MSDQDMSESVEAPLDTELASPRLQFYLRHKANIETWAALKNDVREATGELHAGIREDLEAFASDYGDDVVVRYDAEGTRLGGAEAPCRVTVAIRRAVGRRPETLTLDFGRSRAYRNAAFFTITVRTAAAASTAVTEGTGPGCGR